MKVSNNIGSTISKQMKGVDSAKNRQVEDNNASSLKGKSSADLSSSSKVDVSNRAQMMNKAKAIASDQTVDEAKVAHFQKLIDEGKYNVDSEAVADKMVDEHLLFN
jgi:flagellar biosynthesis anti-sigma factor FlgM